MYRIKVDGWAMEVKMDTKRLVFESTTAHVKGKAALPRNELKIFKVLQTREWIYRRLALTSYLYFVYVNIEDAHLLEST
jgi:hypothetical protein